MKLQSNGNTERNSDIAAFPRVEVPVCSFSSLKPDKQNKPTHHPATSPFTACLFVFFSPSPRDGDRVNAQIDYTS